MFQIKISAAILVVVLAVMGFAHYALTDSVTESIVRASDAELDVGRRAVNDARRLAEESLAQQTDRVAEDALVRSELARLQQMALNAGGIEPLKDQLNRARLFNHLLDWREKRAKSLESRYGKFSGGDAAKLHDTIAQRPVRDWWGTAPDLVLAFVATPLKGERVAHVLAAHAEQGQEIAPALDYADNLPVLKLAEQGRATGFVNWTIHEYFIVASPVFAEGDGAERTLVGTIVLGYQLDAALAERLGSVTGGELAVIVHSDKRLYAPGNVDFKDALVSASGFHPVSDGADPSIDESTDVGFSDLEAGRSYVVALDGARSFMVQRESWREGDDGQSRIGFLVVDDFASATQPVDDLKYQIPLVAAVILIVALVLVTLVIRRFLSPLEDIDVGIQEILAGNRDYLFRARSGNPLQGELVNSLNQLTAYLQGRAAPGEPDQGWDEMMVDLEPERPSIYGMQAVAVVHSDADRKRLRTLYDDYMARRQELNQHVDMDFDRFCRRIKRNEASLKEKHNATNVEFGVAVADGKVVLKPTLRFD